MPHDVAHPGALTGAAGVLKLIDEIAKFAVLMALSAIGLGTDVEAVRRTGIRPFVLGLSLASVLAFCSLGMIVVTGLGGREERRTRSPLCNTARNFAIRRWR